MFDPDQQWEHAEIQLRDLKNDGEDQLHRLRQARALTADLVTRVEDVRARHTAMINAAGSEKACRALELGQSQRKIANLLPELNARLTENLNPAIAQVADAPIGIDPAGGINGTLIDQALHAAWMTHETVEDNLFQCEVNLDEIDKKLAETEHHQIGENPAEPDADVDPAGDDNVIAFGKLC